MSTMDNKLTEGVFYSEGKARCFFAVSVRITHADGDAVGSSSQVDFLAEVRVPDAPDSYCTGCTGSSSVECDNNLGSIASAAFCRGQFGCQSQLSQCESPDPTAFKILNFERVSGIGQSPVPGDIPQLSDVNYQVNVGVPIFVKVTVRSGVALFLELNRGTASGSTVDPAEGNILNLVEGETHLWTATLSFTPETDQVGVHRVTFTAIQITTDFRTTPVGFAIRVDNPPLCEPASWMGLPDLTSPLLLRSTPAQGSNIWPTTPTRSFRNIGSFAHPLTIGPNVNKAAAWYKKKVRSAGVFFLILCLTPLFWSSGQVCTRL